MGIPIAQFLVLVNGWVQFEVHKLFKAVFKFDTPKKGLKRKVYHVIE
jgi:hypothetical protein